MERQKTRAVLASEHPEVQSFLHDLIEKDGDAVTVGRAKNVSEALVLAKKISPDVILIDSYLPYKVGMDKLRMSRMGGLDTAQAISQEVADTKVVLLNNLDAFFRQGRSVLSNGKTYAMKSQGTDISLALPDLRRETKHPNEPIFAFIEEQSEIPMKLAKIGFWDWMTLAGVIAVAAGWFLTLTMVLATAGIVITAAGGVMLLTGFIRKKVKAWRRLHFSERA